MMRYARIENGKVMEQVETDANIVKMFPPQMVWIDVTGVVGVTDGWVAVEVDGNWSVTAPAPAVPCMTEILAMNIIARDQLLATAAVRIAPLQDAMDLGDATAADAELLRRWKQYRVLVNRLDLAVATPLWPEAPDQ